MHFGEIIALLGLGLGAALGLGGLIAPNWASGVVRLKADPDKPGGYSEFRGTYGGFFLLMHFTALLLVLQLSAGPPILTVAATLPVAAAWLGAAAGRVVALVYDADKLRGATIIPVWMAVEAAIGLAVAAPLLQFVF
jgi:hypothetical protein